MITRITVFIILIGMFFMVGCGNVVHTTSTYFSPKLIKDGRIISVKKVTAYKKTIGGLYEDSSNLFVSEITLSGSTETDLFETPEYIGNLVVFNNKIAYISKPDNGITISNFSGDKRNFPGVKDVLYFDMDAEKIVYSTKYDLKVVFL